MSLFPCVNSLRERTAAYYKARRELLDSQQTPQRKEKIADKIRRAAESGKNYVNIPHHWLTGELERELEEGGFRIHERIRTPDRHIDDSPVETLYCRISW